MPVYKIKYQEVLYREVNVRALDSYKAEQFIMDGLITGKLTGQETIQIVDVEQIPENKDIFTGMFDINDKKIYNGSHIFHNRYGHLTVKHSPGGYICVDGNNFIHARLSAISTFCKVIK